MKWPGEDFKRNHPPGSAYIQVWKETNGQMHSLGRDGERSPYRELETTMGKVQSQQIRMYNNAVAFLGELIIGK